MIISQLIQTCQFDRVNPTDKLLKSNYSQGSTPHQNQTSPSRFFPQPTSSNHTETKQLVIRSAEQQDFDSLAEILAYSFYQFPTMLNWLYSPLKLSIYEDLRTRFRSRQPHYFCIVASLVEARSKPIIVGTVEISLRYSSFWSTDRQYPYIANLAVNNSYRRQGIAQKLLTTCEQIAKDWGYQETRLHVLESNYPAKQLYFQTGYQLCQQEYSWHRLLFSCPQRLLLSKKLS